MACVVVVENDPDIGPLLVQLLALEGHRPVLVMDPQQALATVRAEQPDLVYLDVRLTPQLDGFALLEQIRAESAVPVLMCSGLDLERRCLAAGANAFLLKPFDFTDLLGGIARALAPQPDRADPRES